MDSISTLDSDHSSVNPEPMYAQNATFLGSGILRLDWDTSVIQQVKMSSHRAGVYFLADDAAYDQAAAMLSSLRVEAPNITVYCIPFSERTQRLEELSSRMRFTMIDDPILNELDDIGRDIYQCMTPSPALRLAGAFRKFYAFWGPLDRFFYTDSDVILLKGFRQLLENAISSDRPLTYAHEDLNQVYKHGPLRDLMTVDHQSRGINTGLWASRKGLFSLDQIRELSSSIRHVADQFCPTLEQPFLNYCLDVSSVTVSQFDDELECAWAGDLRPMRIKVIGDAMRATWPNRRLIPAIHWAGYKLEPTMPYHHVYRHFRSIGQRPLRRRDILMRGIREDGLCSVPAAIKRMLNTYSERKLR